MLVPSIRPFLTNDRFFPKTKRAQNGCGAFRTGVRKCHFLSHLFIKNEAFSLRSEPEWWLSSSRIVIVPTSGFANVTLYRLQKQSFQKSCPTGIFVPSLSWQFNHLCIKTGSKRIVFLPWRQKRPQRCVEREHPLLHQPVEGDRCEHFRVARNFEKSLESELCAWLR